jgi:hypothetical protein
MADRPACQAAQKKACETSVAAALEKGRGRVSLSLPGFCLDSKTIVAFVCVSYIIVTYICIDR